MTICTDSNLKAFLAVDNVYTTNYNLLDRESKIIEKKSYNAKKRESSSNFDNDAQNSDKIGEFILAPEKTCSIENNKKKSVNHINNIELPTTNISHKSEEIKYNNFNCYITPLISMLMEEDFETGVIYSSEVFFRGLVAKDKNAAMNTIASITLENFSRDPKKIHMLVGVLHILSHMEWDEVYPIGQMISLSLLSHHDEAVAEYAVKCYENWENTSAIEKLEAVKFASPWLQKYANQVINNLKKVV